MFVFQEDMKNIAIELQQRFYESLPDCTEYKFDEHKYLKQNIGYAIYGSPKTNENINTTESNNCYYLAERLNNADADITDTVDYNEEAKDVIDTIYKQMCKCSIETDNSQPIYCSTIYNIIFRPKMKVKSKEKEETEVQKETKAKILEETKEEKKDEKELFMIIPIPIFKIRKQRFIVQKNSSIEPEVGYETWYIDTSGRVYKNWKDYIENNTLPKCTMILPKDGAYEADPSCPVTEDYSTVCLEIVDSPACSWKTKLYNGVDIISSAVGLGTAFLCVASMFTPIAPVVAVTGKSYI